MPSTRAWSTCSPATCSRATPDRGVSSAVCYRLLRSRRGHLTAAGTRATTPQRVESYVVQYLRPSVPGHDVRREPRAAIGCVVDGCPPRIALTEADIQPYLDKRRPGQSRFTTQRREPDEVKILSGVFFDEATGHQVTTGTPIALVIDNVDQRSKDYSDIKDKYRPGHADYTYDAKYGIRDYRGGGRQSARETATRVAAGAIARKIVPGMSVRGALIQMGAHTDRSRALGLGRGRAQSVLLSRCAAGDILRGLSRRHPQARLVRRRRHRGRGRRRSRRPRRADLRQARRRSRRRADGHQRRQGRRDRRRLCRGGAQRRRECRRDAHGQRRQADLSVEQCRRHSRRHFDRPADRVPLCGQADLVDPDPAPHRRPLRQPRPRSAPRAATIPASASARCRSARPWWRA